MKRITLLIVLLAFMGAFAYSQVPKGFNYQAILRNADGNIKANTEVNIELSLIIEAIDGDIVYNEKHIVTTNQFGLVNLVVGQGDTFDDYEAIVWDDNTFFIQIAVNDVIMGTSQLLSVPYALYAEKAGNTFSGKYSDLSDIPTGLADGDDNTQLTETEVDDFIANNGYMTAEVDGSVTNELQAISISNDTIYLSDGGFVKLPAGTSFSGVFTDLSGIPTGLADGDDNTQLTETEVDDFVANNGYMTAEVDGSVTNELQAISISNDTIYLSDGGFVKLPAGTSFSGVFTDLSNIPTGLADGDDNTQLTETEVDDFVANNGYMTAEVDGSVTNELQAISIGNDTIYLSDGGFVKLPAGTSFSGVFTDLSNIPTGLADGDDNTQLTETEVDAYVSNNGYLTSEIDASVSNEIQDLQLSGNNLTITNNGAATTIDLSAYLDNTDTKLNETEVDAFVANNGYLTSEIDASVSNEIQDLQLSGNNLTITNNGAATTIDLSAYLDNTDTKLNETEVDAYVSNNGYLTSEVDGSTTNEIELPSQTGQSGKILTTDGSNPSWAGVSFNDLTDKPVNLDTDDTDDFDGAFTSLTSIPAGLSDGDDVLDETAVDAYVSNNGYLTSEVDGSTTNEIELPTQTGHNGKVLMTNGTSPSWETPAGGGSTNVITISANTTLTTSNEIVFINGAYIATFPASPTDGMKLVICSTNGSAGVNGNGKTLYLVEATFTGDLTFAAGTVNTYTFYYSSTLGVWLGIY